MKVSGVFGLVVCFCHVTEFGCSVCVVHFVPAVSFFFLAASSFLFISLILISVIL